MLTKWELIKWEVDEVGIDNMGIDEVGIDNMGIDEVGIDKVESWLCSTPSHLFVFDHLKAIQKTVGRPRNKASWMLEEDHHNIIILLPPPVELVKICNLMKR